MAPKVAAEFVLPTTVISPIDLNQVLRELEEADQALQAAGLRSGGEEVKLPKVGRLLTDVAEANKLNLLHADERQKLLEQLTNLKDAAPSLHMSFNADPSPAFMQKLTAWLRDEIHPHALVRTGLLPNIGAGCVLRTTNQVFDFSLKNHFDKSYQILVDELKRGVTAEAAS
jgi:F0F1-type ATP synthase delta subunit